MIGYTHGRFQPLHNGHFQTMLKILETHDQLWVGIANPLLNKPQLLDYSDAKLVASLERARDPRNNPYTYLERLEMIVDSFIDYGIDLRRLRVLPHFAFYEINDWEHFIPDPSKAEIILSYKDYHHYQKIKIYEERGWRVNFIEKIEGVSGEIFDQNFPNGDWKKFVPSGVIAHIETKIKK